MRILATIGIAVSIIILTIQANWIGALCGLALVLFTRLATSRKLPPDPDSGKLTLIQRQATAILDQVPGITAAHPRDFPKALPIMTLKDGTTVRTWKNPMGLDHIFLAGCDDRMIYGAYVGWIHSQGLQKAIAKIRRNFS